MGSTLPILLLSAISGAWSLADVRLEVPSHAELGGTVRMKCNFSSSGSALGKALYSLKWYKDDHEFCRYMPSQTPQSQIFPVPGVRVKEESCRRSEVELEGLDDQSSGVYRCEVSTEGPTFQTVVTSRNMSVIAFPERDPVIAGLMEFYCPGQEIRLNCTSAPSLPAPRLTWTVNSVPADEYQLRRYPGVADSSGLLVTGLGLRLAFTSSPLVLSCCSWLANLPPWCTTAVPKLKGSEPKLSARAGNSGFSREASVSTVAASLCLLLDLYFA